MHTNEPITISFFKAFSTEGEELFREFQKRMNGSTLRGYPVRVVEEKVYKMMPAISACFQSDVVIFDGSLEDGKHEQYHAALELMKGLDYVLIVSRTALPFNFMGMRKGGAPELVATGTTEYCPWKTNSEILDWLEDTLQNSSMQLPRKLKMQMPKIKNRTQLESVKKFEEQLLLESVELCKHPTGVFVSYLSRYSKFSGEKANAPFVEELFGEISRVSSVPKEEIRYFPPGKISLEFMTGQRRFEIASITDDFFAGCKAFWIYDTEDYASSWWAYGERVSLSRIFHDSMDKCPAIYTAKPVKQPNGSWKFDIKAYLTEEQKRGFLPDLTEKQMTELTQIYINSHPDSVAYEQIKKMRRLAKVPDIFLKLQAAAVYEQARSVIESVGELDDKARQELENLKDVEYLKESVRSYAYTKEFWEDHILECLVCRAQVGEGLDPESFMHFSKPYFYRLPPEKYRDIRRILQTGCHASVKLPCGHTFELAISGTYHRWWTVKSDVPTGPKGALVEQIDFVSFV